MRQGMHEQARISLSLHAVAHRVRTLSRALAVAVPSFSALDVHRLWHRKGGWAHGRRQTDRTIVSKGKRKKKQPSLRLCQPVHACRSLSLPPLTEAARSELHVLSVSAQLVAGATDGRLQQRVRLLLHHGSRVRRGGASPSSLRATPVSIDLLRAMRCARGRSVRAAAARRWRSD